MKTDSLTIFAGAFLLFLVQPLMARFILPWFGGSPSVWTACMLFFQAFLLAGYAYAHASARWLRPRQQVLLHMVLVAAALLFVPIMPGVRWKPAGEANPVGRILLLLTATIGLPYFVLAATSPLLQSWLHRAQPRESLYRLYAVSNVGSLLALVSYPFVFEPLFTRRMQANIWSCGLVIYAGLALACSRVVWRTGKPVLAARARAAGAGSAGPRPSAGVQALWLGLAACASVLLLGTTNKLCQNVAVVPFLWVSPLGLYLLSFILCFERAAWYQRTVFSLLLVPILSLLILSFDGGNGPLLWHISLYWAGLFVCCMVCHGELFRLRPAPRDLTLFYLMIAAGGALGGVLVAMVAPRVFKTYAELNWGLCLLGLLLAIVHAREGTVWKIHTRRCPLWPGIAIGTLALASVILVQSRRDARGGVVMSRNFFGTLRVQEVGANDPVLHGYSLKHGTIQHGAQFVDPVRAKIPLTYYGVESGVGLAMKYLPRAANRRIGLVGLGAGTLAAYGKPGDTFRFYEIDSAVHRIATQWFTYLKDSAAHVEVVLGDARLSLESEPDQAFDLLVLDAFSGDAPPLHLLTREAFATYLRHLKPDGVIAMHSSNTHVNFFPVMYGVIEYFNMSMALIPWEADPMPPGLTASDWILMSRNPAFLNSQPILSRSRKPSAPGSTTPVFWTDDDASLFKVFLR